MTQSEKDREEFLQKLRDNNEFVCSFDGYVYWWPSTELQGCLASYQLRWIAEELDVQNKGWDEQINKFFIDDCGSESGKDGWESKILKSFEKEI